MTAIRDRHAHRIGITRRELIQIGYSGLVGIGLPSILAARGRASTSPVRPKSVLLVFMTGAPSHIDTFDMKPDAPAEVRGSFKPIDTNVPGVQVCEHLPLMAARAEKWAVVRSMTHGLPSHEHATHMLLTGIDKMPPGATHMASRNDWPCYASGLDFLRPRSDGVPSGVMLPTYLNNGYGFSGQHAGVLGAKYDPWQLTHDPNAPDFRMESLQLPVGLTADRLDGRKSLLAEIDGQQRRMEQWADRNSFGGLQDKAFALLTAGKVKQAFAIEREDPRLRDRYGRHMFGQSLLLARRLIQAGVPIVQANMGHMNTWDTHNNNCSELQNRLLPPFDRAVSTLLDDLESSGMLDETLVVMVGEFGRTPKLVPNVGVPNSGPVGRDHWAGVFSAVFAGAGVRGGQAIGKSDKIGAYPASRGFWPSDVGATIYTALGADPASTVVDQLQRPLQLNRGDVIGPLYSGGVA
ncbi:MAG: DUF1501 domain-containing protein [Isosphaeraceae bacterium]|nr:DUF1501 domain-containing protein [Isosphaeraceae bacterium]